MLRLGVRLLGLLAESILQALKERIQGFFHLRVGLVCLLLNLLLLFLLLPLPLMQLLLPLLLQVLCFLLHRLLLLLHLVLPIPRLLRGLLLLQLPLFFLFLAVTYWHGRQTGQRHLGGSCLVEVQQAAVSQQLAVGFADALLHLLAPGLLAQGAQQLIAAAGPQPCPAQRRHRQLILSRDALHQALALASELCQRGSGQANEAKACQHG
mmetsp:Transcript_7476/g.17896  ORF Transcript_7476/g.17896 Transcript_7476/m.17896 type:complete len:209 (+) Transcript_7476:698-1324(+)